MMDSQNKVSPIFIHSLFRSGSTYLFNVFRRSPVGYWCYQEPIHEIALLSKDNPDDMLNCTGENVRSLRHPILERPHFYELHNTVKHWRESITKEIIYDDYYGMYAHSQRSKYLCALVDGAQGRPVIQECRTALRIAAIQQDLGGVHLYLWRNPWDQWWSYKVTDYFDIVNQLILNAPGSPKVIASLKLKVGFKEFHSEDIQIEFTHFGERKLSAEHSYLVFYTLWCLGLLNGMEHADTLINIDVLSDSMTSREKTLKCLADLGIDGLDFSDCEVSQARYGKEDTAFFQKLEDQVHKDLLLNGYCQSQLDTLLSLRQEHEPNIWNVPQNELAPKKSVIDAVRARGLARRLESSGAFINHKMLIQIQGKEDEVLRLAEQGQQLGNKLKERERQLGNKLKVSQHEAFQLAETLVEREQQLDMIYQSRSWRLTRVFREINIILKKFICLIATNIQECFGKF